MTDTIANWPRHLDDHALGRVPFVKLDEHGIRLVTPPGEVDEHGRTVHTISRDRAREMARTLQWLAAAHVGEDGTIYITESL